MPFLKLSELELRELAKQHIEALEFWLRRVVEEGLVAAAGVTYWQNEPPIIREKVRSQINERISKSPSGRFPRWIDATLLEHLIELICRNDLFDNYYKPHFIEIFSISFSERREYLKFILEKLAIVRNALYHINPLSVRQVEQAVCYTNDILDSIKNHYQKTNRQMSFNVPSIFTFSDSLGRVIHYRNNAPEWKHINYEGVRTFYLGDRVRFSVEIDASFESDSYTVNWLWASQNFELIGMGSQLEIEFNERWIGISSNIRVRVISNKNWHKHSGFDDELYISMKVLPLPE